MEKRAELKTAIEAVKAAGKISLKHFGKHIDFEMKGDDTPVTKTDKMCEKRMLEIIKKRFPDDSILSEESKELHKDPKRRWIVDPIDGTKAFIHGIPTYGNMAAFEESGEIVCAAITVPALGKLFFAEKGKGAFEGNGKRIRVSREPHISKATILHGRGKGFLEKGYLKKLRILLNTVYHSWGFNDPFAFYLLATGRVDAVVETFPHAWDVAAPLLIIKEAGGRFTDLAGRETIHSNTIAVFSNNKIHDALLEILRK
ncbi:MAG: inositol monophosphatase family protein [Candidatus Micrarchaeota archaeon]